MTLEQTLKNAAYKVWDELTPHANAAHTIFSVREEGLTSMALKEISNSACAQIITLEMISAKKEKLRGYDFELAIGSSRKNQFIRFFIQAKKLVGNKIKDSYDEIEAAQTELLMDYAKKNRSLATFAFFNHLDENDLTLQDHFNSLTPFDKRAMGITLTSAYSVKRNGKKFSAHHDNGGMRFSPKIYALRNFPHLFFFYDHYKHLAIPFHELSYLTIDLAELVNKLYRQKQKKGTLPLLFLLFPGFEDLLGDDGDLIPIINTSAERLREEFIVRSLDGRSHSEFYHPLALVIMETGEPNT